MRVGNGLIGFGGASAGILGSTTPNDDSLHALRKHVLEFAHEYARPQPSQAALLELAGRVEGSLQTMQLFHGLSEQAFNDLLNDLDALMDAAAKR